MSCGCGGLPPSVLIRLEAAKLVPNGDVAMASALADFIRGTRSDAELDAAAQRRGPDQTSRARNEFLLQPPNVLACKPVILAKLAKHGVATIGTLIQWHAHQLRDHAEFDDPAAVEAVSAELTPHGLRLGMTPDDIRHWILHGPVEAQGARQDRA